MPPLSTDYIFMSYSRKDDAVMQRIVTFLREQGIKVWVDNEKLIPGTPVWEKEIEKAVQGASAVVVVLSPDSKDSEWVRREISLADQYEKRVFPVMVRGDEKTSISIRLIGRQYVDIRSAETAGLHYVTATLLRYLEELNEREQNAKKEASRLAAQKTKTEKRLAKQKAEEERIANEKLEAERKAKEETDRLAAQKIEEEHIAHVTANEERLASEKLETDRKAKEEIDHLAAQRLELESKEKLAHENSEREAREKLVREKTERGESEKVKPEIKIESVAEKPAVLQPEPKKQSGMKLPLWGIGLIALAVLALIVWRLSAFPASPESNPTFVPTQTPFTSGTPTRVPATLTPTPGIGSIFISDGVTMLYVPAGTFSMGSEKSDDEKPIHAIDLDAYYIDKYEVTNAAYKRCVDAGECDPPSQKSSNTHPSYYGDPKFAEYPVVYVSAHMADQYCTYYRGTRLPTEAEWEKAARGMDSRTYPWGEDITCDKANYQNGCVGDTTKVGSYPDGISPYGLYDMTGNVWEWVNDWYDEAYYQYSSSSNPIGPTSPAHYQVMRGGSWSSSFYEARSADRYGNVPTSSFNYVGFRCAR